MSNMLDGLKYLKHTLFHPFDGFHLIRHANKGNLALATILLVLYGVMSCVTYQYTGFVVNMRAVHNVNSIYVFTMALIPFFLFCISNWSITTITNGKGRIVDIYIVICYSLAPVILINLITVIISNFIITEEYIILAAFNMIGYAWFIFVAFAGLCTIHEYSLGTNIISLILTLFSAIIIVFLAILYFSLMEKMIGFFTTFISELGRRLLN